MNFLVSDNTLKWNLCLNKNLNKLKVLLDNVSYIQF